MKKIIGLLGGVLYVAFGLEGAEVPVHGAAPVEMAYEAGILNAVQKKLEDQRFAFPHDIQFKDYAKNKQFKAAYDAIKEDLDATLKTDADRAAEGGPAGTGAAGAPLVNDESVEHMKRLRNEIAARDFMRRAEEHYKVHGDVEAIKSKRSDFASYNPVQIPLAIAEK
ncbi:MAG: hypothetical protein WCJ17_03945, partial [bacterium]